MITKVKIVNRWTMNDLLKAPEDKLNRDGKAVWHLISIYSDPNEEYLTPENIEVIKKLGCREMLSLRFWDVTTENFRLIVSKYPTCVLFGKGHAKRIVSFIDMVKLLIEDASLIVHCDAGISRSGAVGSFAAKYLDLDPEDFHKLNPNIFPNPHVYRVLMNVSGLSKIMHENYGEVFRI